MQFRVALSATIVLSLFAVCDLKSQQPEVSARLWKLMSRVRFIRAMRDSRHTPEVIHVPESPRPKSDNRVRKDDSSDVAGNTETPPLSSQSAVLPG